MKGMKESRNELETLDTHSPACVGSPYGGNRTNCAIAVRALLKRTKASNQLRVKVGKKSIHARAVVLEANDEGGGEDDEDDDGETGKIVTDQVFVDKMCTAELHCMITLRCIFYCGHPNAFTAYRRL